VWQGVHARVAPGRRAAPHVQAEQQSAAGGARSAALTAPRGGQAGDGTLGAICSPPPVPGQPFLRGTRQQLCKDGLTCAPLKPAAPDGAAAPAAAGAAAGAASGGSLSYGYCALAGAAGAVAAAADEGPAAVLVAQRKALSGKPCRLPLLYKCAPPPPPSPPPVLAAPPPGALHVAATPLQGLHLCLDFSL